ncbi:hypothetical protein [Cyclobacterium lianum]|nr:hypothetical protein [Cyclobacterium lianum]
MGPSEIRQFVRLAKEKNIDQINLRINNKGVINARIDHGTVYQERLDAFGEDFDPLRVLVDEGHQLGIKVGVHFDLFESSYDQFFITHPEFTPQARKDTVIYNAFPSYAHKEVRDYMLGRVRDLAAYGVDQVFFCTKSSHTPQNMTHVPRNTYAAYNLPVVEKYKELYGIDILTSIPDRKKVAKIHGDFIIEFLKEAKNMLRDDNITTLAGATLSGYLQPSGENIFLDWKTMISNQAADGLVMANSRGETFAWYEKGGIDQFLKIRMATKENDMDFYAYILSTVYWKVKDEYSWSHLLEYIPRQLHFFHQMGADGVLIHEVYQKEIWEALGNWKETDQDDLQKTEVPNLERDYIASMFDNPLPHGSFEKENSRLFWEIVPAWSSMNDWLPGRNIASGLTLDDFVKYWTSDNQGNEHLFAIYDWKVMASSEFSGRSYSGRSAMLVYAENGAGKGPHRAVSWKAESEIPEVPEGPSRFSVQIHGEDLKGIEWASMRIVFKDANDHVIKRIEEKEKVEGSFSWRELASRQQIPANSKEMEVVLEMVVASNTATHGRLWFDAFRISDASGAPATENFKIITSAEAPDGTRYGSFQIKKKGYEITSQEFLLDKGSQGQIELFLRTSRNESMELLINLGEGNTKRVKINDKWTSYLIPLTHLNDQIKTNLTIRPLGSGTLHVDHIHLK